jgi:hypothetical protein
MTANDKQDDDEPCLGACPNAKSRQQRDLNPVNQDYAALLTAHCTSQKERGIVVKERLITLQSLRSSAHLPSASGHSGQRTTEVGIQFCGECRAPNLACFGLSAMRPL